MRCFFFSLFAVAFLVTAGCTVAPVGTDTTGTDPESGSRVSQETADRECSYFYFLWGRHAELQGKYEEALEAYEKTLICDPDAGYAARKLPLILIRLGRVEEARDRLEKYLVRHPDESGARMLLARILIQEKKWDEAVAQYRLIHEQDPRETRSLLLLADLYLNTDRAGEASQVLEQVLRLDPESYPAHVLLARIHARAGDIDRALPEYRRALALNWSVDLEMELAELLVRGKRYRQAEKVYRRILHREPVSEQPAIGLIHVLLMQKKEAAALEELERLKRITSDPSRIELAMARIHARRNENKEAVRILETILARSENSQARYLLGLIAFRDKNYRGALAQFSRIDESAEEFEDALFLRVRLLRLLHRDAEAVALLEKALADDQVRNVDLYILLASMYQLQGKIGQGEKVFARALRLFPKDDRLLYEFGLFLDQQGHPDRAMQVMQQVIALQPENASALNYIGYTWADQKKHLDQALEYIQRAVRLKPKNGYIRDSLGWVYYRLGRLDEARRELEEANRLAPDDPAILDHLGDVYLESGRKDKALATYQKALSLAKDDQEKKRLQEKIRLVGKPDPS